MNPLFTIENAKFTCITFLERIYSRMTFQPALYYRGGLEGRLRPQWSLGFHLVGHVFHIIEEKHASDGSRPPAQFLHAKTDHLVSK